MFFKKITVRMIVISAIVSTLVFLILISAYTFGKINVLLKGDIDIALSPEEKTLLTQRGSSQNITFEININNVNLCKAICTYEFQSLSENKIIDEGSYIGVKGTNINKSYVLLAPEKGTGQIAYQFSTECTNEQSFFCLAEPKKRIKSSFVTLTYEISEQDRLNMLKAKDNLLAYFDLLESYDIQSKILEKKISYLSQFTDVSDTYDESVKINQSLSEQIKTINLLKSEWDDEEYSQINENISFLIEQTKPFNLSFILLDGQILRKQFEYNNVSQRLNAFAQNLNVLDEMNLESTFAGKNFSSEEYILSYKKLVEKFNRKEYLEYVSILSELSLMEKKLLRQHAALKSEFSNISKKGIYLFSNSSYSKDIIGINDSEQILASIQLSCSNIRSYFSTFSQNINNINSSNLNSSLNASNIKTINQTSNETENSSNQNISSQSNQPAQTQLQPRQDILQFNSSYCGKILPEKINISSYAISANKINMSNMTFEVATSINKTLNEHKEICCIFNSCNECCIGDKCQQVYPVILLHGHAFSEQTSASFSLDIFDSLKSEFEKDGFIDVGVILAADLSDSFLESQKGVYGKFGKPIVVAASYYLDSVKSSGDNKKVSLIPSKNESIEIYSKRLNETIELVKYKSGAKKVNIVAHSMGGLVAREYLSEFGEDSVNKLIFVGTPNKGITKKVEGLCPIAGGKVECDEMASTSDFLNQLNTPINDPKNIKTYVIVGKGCDMDGEDGDGIVLVKNAELSYSLNFEIPGSCDGISVLHETILDTNKYPKTYEIIRNVLK